MFNQNRLSFSRVITGTPLLCCEHPSKSSVNSGVITEGRKIRQSVIVAHAQWRRIPRSYDYPLHPQLNKLADLVINVRSNASEWINCVIS